jgi:hypothetical protein
VSRIVGAISVPVLVSTVLMLAAYQSAAEL